jgi:hypothetical protein
MQRASFAIGGARYFKHAFIDQCIEGGKVAAFHLWVFDLHVRAVDLTSRLSVKRLVSDQF